MQEPRSRAGSGLELTAPLLPARPLPPTPHPGPLPMGITVAREDAPVQGMPVSTLIGTFNDSSQKKLFNVPRRGSTQSGVINSPLAGVADQGVVYPGLRTCPLGRPLQAPDQNQAFH